MSQPKPPTLSVRATVQVKLSDIQSLLISAFEGGSNDWYFIHQMRAPARYDVRLEPGEVNRLYDYPVNPGGYLTIIDLYNECEKDNAPPHRFFGGYEFKGWKPRQKGVRLNLKTIKKGLQVFAEKYPAHFADLVNDKTDAITGDVFLQCCVFGEIVYC